MNESGLPDAPIRSVRRLMRSRASQRLQTREQASRLDLECICRKISITSSSGRKVLIRSCPFIGNDQAFSTLETREMRKGRKISEIPQQDSRRRWLWRWRWDWYRGEEAVEWAVGGRKGIWGGAFCKLPSPLSLSLSLSLSRTIDPIIQRSLALIFS